VGVTPTDYSRPRRTTVSACRFLVRSIGLCPRCLATLAQRVRDYRRDHLPVGSTEHQGPGSAPGSNVNEPDRCDNGGR
jgi:hypothetical protein